MANIDRFMIAPLDSGMQTDLKPWLIPDKAFSHLRNAYVFRGRVRKRFGSRLLNSAVADNVAQLYSRLRVKVGTTAAVTGNLGATIMPGAKWKIGQLFSVGATIFTAYQPNGATYTTGTATATYNTATGSLVITGNGENQLTDVYFYPAEPVMGLIPYESSAVNNEVTFAFDTQFAYEYVSGAWRRLGTATWTGDNSQFFWGCNYRGVEVEDYSLFVTNFKATDAIQYWNGTTWTALNPIVNKSTGSVLKTCRLIVPFKGRLLALNTVEGVGAASASYTSRCRYCQNGTPLPAADVDAWAEDVTGKGDYVDAPTKEQIVSCGFIKDRLIVYFERSTWELAHTGNQILPFVWNRINTELGVESTFSAVPFDTFLLGIGNVGIHACNGSNVDRIDQKIPDEIFEISNTENGTYRVYGIRDYYVQMVYWAFCSPRKYSEFPNKVLLYNYITHSWAINDDSFTCFGYFQPQSARTWAEITETWAEWTAPWNSGEFLARFRNVAAGNQEGFVFLIDADFTSNAPSIQVTNLVKVTNKITITAIDHNFSDSDYVKFESASGITSGLNGKIFKIYDVSSKDAFVVEEYEDDPVTGTYNGAGTVTRVSNINIVTKEYNFYSSQGRNAYVSKVDFQLDRTAEGEVAVDYYVSSGALKMVAQGQITGAALGTNILETYPYAIYPFEATQHRLWHPIYFQADGEFIQLSIYMTYDQMIDPAISESDFQLHAMIFYATPTASRLQ